MVDWHSPEELMKESVVFVRLMHALFGLYLWEFVVSLDFDFALVTRKRKFKWPMLFYMGGRYCLLFALIGIMIAFNTTAKLDCTALYTFNQLAGDAAVGFASINLSLRTIAIWQKDKFVVGGLIIVMLGHWALILHGVLLGATWVDGVGCVIVEAHTTILAATFIYSMAFDALVLALTAYKLCKIGVRPSLTSNASVLEGGSRLGRMLFNDGLCFFIVAFIANLIASVFMILNLNPLMSLIFNVPSAVASTIVASRAVRRLTNSSSTDAELFVSAPTSALAFRHIPDISETHQMAGVGVHVEMETFSSKEPVKMANPYTTHEGEEGRGSDSTTMVSKRNTISFAPASLHLHSDNTSEVDLEGQRFTTNNEKAA